jgi:hypothetical protein
VTKSAEMVMSRANDLSLTIDDFLAKVAAA